MRKSINKVGYIVGRFQCPYIHIGHIHLISSALRECDEVVILLGCIGEKMTNEQNPYDIDYRIEQINKIFPQVKVVPIFDRETDEEWSEIVDEIIKITTELYNEPEIALYHSRDSFVTSYHGIHKTIEIEEIPQISATKIRQQNS